MRPRHSTTARLTHVATIGDEKLSDGSLRRRLVVILAMTTVILVVFFLARHCGSHILAAHWQQSLDTVPDDRAEMLVASAARLGRPGLPVLVAAMGSPRQSVSAAGRTWLKRQMKAWENLADDDAQRNVAALAETLAAELDRFDPATRLEAARLAQRLLMWRLDGDVVNRARVTWLCDRVLHAAKYSVHDSDSDPKQQATTGSLAATEEARETLPAKEELLPPAPLEIPDLPQNVQARAPFTSLANLPTSSDVVPLPSVNDVARTPDIADAWTMRGHRLGLNDSGLSEAKIYSDTRQRVLVPSATDGNSQSSQTETPIRDLSLIECMQRLHRPGLESLAAEEELKRRGFDPLRLSIARRVYHPDYHVRLQLIRDLPGIPGIDATDWLIALASDEREEVRLAAITLLATLNNPSVLAQVEAIARSDTSERIRAQAQRVAKRRHTLTR